MKWYRTVQFYMENDPAAKSIFEVLLLYPGFHAVSFYRIAHQLYRYKLYFLARLISQLARFLTQIEIHPGANIGLHFMIDHGSGIVIGETSVIGDYCVMYHGVTLGGKTSKDEQRHPMLSNHVTIGAHAQIIGPVLIEDNVIIGAGAVVTKDVSEGSIVVGNPARPIK